MLAQTNQPTNRPTDQPTDRAKTIYYIGPNALTSFMKKARANCVLTRFYSSTLRKTVMSTGSLVSLQTGTNIIRINILTKIYGDMAKNVTSREFTRFHYSHIKTIASRSMTSLVFKRKTAQPCYIRSFMKGALGLVMGPCIVDRIVIREVQYQLEVNRCRNEEIIVKGNFGWAWPMWEGHPRIDRIVIRETDRHRAQTMTNDSALAVCLSLKSVRICTIFDLIQDIIGTNLRTKFHDDQTINVASRMLTRKNALPPGSHVFQPISIIFKLVQDIIGMNLLTMFHEDPTINVASRVKNAPPLGSHVFQANITIFKLIQDIIETNLLTKFHEDWTMRPLEKNAPPPGGHFFKATKTIFKLIQDIIGKIDNKENAPPHKCHVFQPTGVILKLVKDIIGLNLK
ncbi:hypothetical protein DPMN_117791 [Dreissena polymorpha]|uniref:Uncharacterized protein n=1 Tax=Dreissena polymorpha TaxID=45954 RepID=A0A9D4GGD1_DREPO|nr:hypothetical protein DPMN_117791 [Dreissena polymorpha]